jgi:excisionase family DNA binding protein
MSDRLLTTREVAERLRVAPATVLRWRSKRGLPSVELTSRVTRYRETELESWLAQLSTGTADRGCQTPERTAPVAGHPSLVPPAGVRLGSSDARPLDAVTTEEERDAC